MVIVASDKPPQRRARCLWRYAGEMSRGIRRGEPSRGSSGAVSYVLPYTAVVVVFLPFRIGSADCDLACMLPVFVTLPPFFPVKSSVPGVKYLCI
jgi:hypothetical protein